MSSRPAGQEKLPKKDRKALAREFAKIEREREVQRRRRNRRLGWTAAGTAVVAVGVVAVLVVQSSIRAGQVGPNNMLSDGVVLGGDGSAITAARTTAIDAGGSPVSTEVDRTSGVLDLVLYLDYRSPEAETLWSTSSAAIEQWVTAGYATLELHPLALLDGTTVTAAPSASPSASASATAGDDATVDLETTGDYSLRAAGALACVADAAPDSALAVHDALLAAQPGLGASGLDDDELIALVQGAGVTDETVADCIGSGAFTDWAQEATDRAADGVPYDVGSVTTSPVLLVGGQEYTGALDDTDALIAFIEEVSTRLAEEAAAAEPTATPTPTPTDAAEPTDTPTAG